MHDDFRRYVWVSVGYIAGSCIVAGIAIAFLSSNIHGHTRSIIAIRETLSARNQLLETAAAFKQIAPQIEQYETQLNTLIPKRDALIDYGGWIQALGGQNQVSARASFAGDPPPAPGDGTLGRADITLQVSGPLDKIERFLRALEVQSPKFLTKVETFELVAGGDGYGMNGRGAAFFQ